MSRSRGVVLVTVLWVILVLSLVSFSLASAVRVEVNASRDSFDSERAFYMAKGAAEVVYGHISNNRDFPEHGPVRIEKTEYVFPFESGEARIWLEYPGRFIDINDASDILLASVFDSLGLTQEIRNRLVDSILDWRDDDDIPHLYGAETGDYAGQQGAPRNGGFRTVDEVLRVKNMTPGIFYGSLTFDSVTQQYHRIPGLRELVTVEPGGKINPNRASFEVLLALPQMNRAIAERIISERSTKMFESIEDLVSRVPDLFERAMLDYITLESGSPNMLVSRATIASSGISRTVRLSFIKEQKVRIYSTSPLFFRRVEEFRRGRWWFD